MLFFTKIIQGFKDFMMPQVQKQFKYSKRNSRVTMVDIASNVELNFPMVLLTKCVSMMLTHNHKTQYLMTSKKYDSKKHRSGDDFFLIQPRIIIKENAFMFLT